MLINANDTQCQGIPMLLQQIQMTVTTNFEKDGEGGGEHNGLFDSNFSQTASPSHQGYS